MSTTACLTVQRSPLRTREASRDRHCTAGGGPGERTAAVTRGEGPTGHREGGCVARRIGLVTQLSMAFTVTRGLGDQKELTLRSVLSGPEPVDAKEECVGGRLP